MFRPWLLDDSDRLIGLVIYENLGEMTMVRAARPAARETGR
ncbi:hypothetical protein [Kumtagia ephedrae]|nr:hypothetical protein [Mesorhizobium ephedrae]